MGQLINATFLEKTDVFEHEPIKGVDLSVLHNLTEVYLGFVFWCELGMCIVYCRLIYRKLLCVSWRVRMCAVAARSSVSDG